MFDHMPVTQRPVWCVRYSPSVHAQIKCVFQS